MSLNPYLGEISMFAGNFAPRGWAFCNGQLLPIASNSALYSLLGTHYGGDGRTTFALPDLRGRVPLGWNGGATGPGLLPYIWGQKGGTESVALIQSQMPLHTHYAQVSATGASISGKASAVMYSNATAGTDVASGNFIANNLGGEGFARTTDRTTLNDNAISVDTSNLSVNITGLSIANSNAGSSLPHENRQPFQTTSFIIAVQGIFPSRS